MVRCNCIAYFFNTYWHSISQVDGIAWCGNGVLGHRLGVAYFWSLPWIRFAKGGKVVSHRRHTPIFIKRWRPIRTAEPKVQAVPPLRHPPSARKSRWHPSLRPFHAELSCLLLDGSTKCPTISGCTRSFNRFWT